MNKRNLLLASLTAGAGLAMFSRLLLRSRSPRKASSDSVFDALDAEVREVMRRLAIPGAVLAVVERGQIVHTRGFGRARPGGEAPTARTPFAIGSLTKAVTATAVMQLVASGKIELDAPIQCYLPWFSLADPLAAAQITVRHLLNQTSGLPTWCGELFLADLDERPGATLRQARQLSAVKPIHPAGQTFEYCNMNYNLLGLVIEAASGVTYARYLQEQVLVPLGMDYSYASQTIARRHGMAVGHQMWFWTPVARPGLPMPSGSLASGQLISTAEDMAHLLIAHLEDGKYKGAQILASKGTEELHRGVADVTAMGRSLGQYAMGWFVGQVGERRILWHAGCVPDFTAVMALLPEEHKGLVLLVNCGHYMMNPAMTEAGIGLAAVLAGEAPAPKGFGFSRFAPWLMRSLLLVPFLQLLDVGMILRRLRRRHQEPTAASRIGRSWGRRHLLPLLAYLALGWAPIRLLRSRRRGFLTLFLPDFCWTILTSGILALVWGPVRAALSLFAPGSFPLQWGSVGRASRREMEIPLPGSTKIVEQA